MTAETSSHGFPPLAAFLDHPGNWPGDAPEPGLAALLAAIARACQGVGKSAALGRLMRFDAEIAVNVQGETQKPLDIVANDIFIRECGPFIRGLVSEEMDEPLCVDERLGTAPYLLLIDPLDGSANMELAMTVGAFFSVLRAPSETVKPADFLQPGDAQIAAGYALFGPTTMLVLSVGRGTHGFTLDPEDGQFHLTHPHMTISPDTREFAINASNARFWEPPVQLYVQHCQEGAEGPRGGDYNMRWNGALVAELHRVLVRGGVFLYPFDNRLPKRKGRLRLLYEVNPCAMLAEAAGGAASSGRGRILEIVPQEVHERAPLIFGAPAEVARLEAHHSDFDRGVPLVFQNPLFRDRTLFRTA
jgi:fructose-1,6-bisphosphatase I/sedoheptulose-1,7-bisphosphatase